MNVRRWCLCAAFAIAPIVWRVPPAAGDQLLLAPGIHGGIVFDSYPPIATASEIVRRFLSPLAAEAVRRRLQLTRIPLKQELFDSRSEQFLVYVPRERPAGGYALLVFVPPWPQAKLPAGWERVLDKYGVIFVSPLRAGNEQNVLERRVPLALAALAGIQARLPVNPARRLIGGFSGGSRVAMQIALAYPDLFSGALLNAGSDPIGHEPVHLPTRDLMLEFQIRTRLAYLTGGMDEPSLSMDSASIESMRHWCVANVNARSEHGAGHDPASAQGFDWAIQALLAVPHGDSKQLSACRAAREKDVEAAVASAEAVIGTGDPPDRRRMLREIDGKYGGLAAPRTITLADRCSCGMLDSAAAGSPPR